MPQFSLLQSQIRNFKPYSHKHAAYLIAAPAASDSKS